VVTGLGNLSPNDADKTCEKLGLKEDMAKPNEEPMNGIMSQALTDFLSSEEYQKIKEQDLANHKKFVEKFLKKDTSKTASEEPSHNPQSPETPEE